MKPASTPQVSLPPEKRSIGKIRKLFRIKNLIPILLLLGIAFLVFKPQIAKFQSGLKIKSSGNYVIYFKINIEKEQQQWEINKPKEITTYYYSVNSDGSNLKEVTATDFENVKGKNPSTGKAGEHFYGIDLTKIKYKLAEGQEKERLNFLESVKTCGVPYENGEIWVSPGKTKCFYHPNSDKPDYPKTELYENKQLKKTWGGVYGGESFWSASEKLVTMNGGDDLLAINTESFNVSQWYRHLGTELGRGRDWNLGWAPDESFFVFASTGFAHPEGGGIYITPKSGLIKSEAIMLIPIAKMPGYDKVENEVRIETAMEKK